MICFHSLNYWYLQQQKVVMKFYQLSCDLLSFFELLIFTTTFNVLASSFIMLWFAFILWTTDIYNNVVAKLLLYFIVVICFHSLNYWYLQQQNGFLRVNKSSCDLLSFFELLIFTTTNMDRSEDPIMLWFAFILWTTDIYNNFDN